MRDVIIFSGSDLIRFALKTIIEPVIMHRPDRVSSTLKVCTSLPEFEREILASVNPVVIFDIDNISFFNQYHILEVIKKKINEINLIFYSKESELLDGCSFFTEMDLIYICKTASIMEIESTINQCFSRFVTSLNEMPNVFSFRKSKLSGLTGRENQILPLLMFGMATKDIANSLSVNVKTISSHKMNILKKYQTSSLIELYNKWKEFPS